MYLREAHAEHDVGALRELIRENPLGILTTAISSANYPLLQCTHIPFVLDVDDESGLGRLRGHLARQNPHSKAMIEALTAAGASSDNTFSQEAMVLFTSPIHHYVTPKFYVETKPATGKVVPTWNYAAAQVYGRPRIYFDSRDDTTLEFLSKQVDDLSQMAEVDIMGHTGEDERPQPWRVADAPERYVQPMLKSIIGIEIPIERLEGKFKMSQELRDGDRRGVIRGFEDLGSQVGRGMAQLVEQRDELKKAALGKAG